MRFNAEADSLNCSILGPDARPGTPEFDLYVTAADHRDDGQGRAEVHRDPAGIRAGRLLDAVAEAASASGWPKVVVGNPADPGVRMGALASLEQREEVRRSLKALEGAATIVFGDPEHVDVVGADAERGAFMSPVLLRADDPDRAEPHEVEAFGPVATLLPLPLDGPGDRAGRTRPGQPGRVGGHR